MARQDNEAGAPKDERIVREARERWKRCAEWEGSARKLYVEDVKFCEADPDHREWQWPDTQLRKRDDAKAPSLVINKTRQHCLQIVNDARQNKAQIRIRPVGDGATYEAAKVFEGVCRHIEYISNAMEAYDAATWHQVTGGWGYWRVVTDYIDAKSFDQDIYIRRIHDPLSVYLDPDIQEFDGSDARFGFVFRDMPRELFEAEFPKWKDEAGLAPLGNDPDGWSDKSQVRIAEYYRKSDQADTLLFIADPLSGQATQVLESEIEAGRDALPPGTVILKERAVTRDVVEWFKIVGGDKIVERATWPGSYIPLVRVIGEETVIDGQLDRKGHTRALKDPQRMYNYWSSAATEHIALQSKSPFVGPNAAFEGNESWKTANTENYAFLGYNHMDDEGNPIPAPVRQAPPQSSAAYIEGMRTAQQELMMASGQYQSQFGENENAKSGVAIQTRQRQGDNATYHYIDHLAQAIRFTGRILIDLIPKVYDTPRLIKIMAESGDENEVNVNPQAPQPHMQLVDGQPASAEQVKAAQADPDMADKVQTIFNPSVGRYEVEADIGPAFATKRQEAFQAFSDVMANNPAAFQLAGDIWMRNGDFPGADEFAERLKRTIPPNVLGEGPPPQLAAMQQQFEQQKAGLMQLVQKLVEQNADKDLKLKQRDDDHHLKSYDAETRRLSAVNAIDPAALLPVVRDLVSEILGERVEPHIAAHVAFDQSLQPQPEPAEAMQ